MKHVELDQQLVQDEVVVGELVIKKINIENNLTDIIVKSLPKHVLGSNPMITTHRYSWTKYFKKARVYQAQNYFEGGCYDNQYIKQGP